MSPSPIAAQDRSEPPEGYIAWEDYFEWEGWWFRGWNTFEDFGPFPDGPAAIAAAWAHSEREQG